MRYILIFLFCINLFSETEFAEPKPDIDNPRKILFQISSGDEREINHVLSSANNVLKFYGPENTQMAIVCYYDGIKALLQNQKDIRVRVEALMTYDVEFIACENTMKTKKIEKKELLDDITYVTAGIVEVIERSLKGYVVVRP